MPVNLLKYSFALYITLILSTYSVAQEYYPTLKLSKDTVKLGEQFTITLRVQHSPAAELVFPDSSFDFSPLELINKQHYTTSTQNNISTDSIVYLFTMFETEPFKLSLPVFEYINAEKYTYYSDTVFVTPFTILPEKANNQEVLENTEYRNVELKVDYIRIGIISGIVIVIISLIILLFRKKLIRYVDTYRLRKLQSNYLTQFDLTTATLENEFDTDKLEKFIFNWKNHISKLGVKNFNTLSTREIAERFPSSAVKQVLADCDKAIYGNIKEQQLISSLNQLKEFAIKQFEKRIEQLNDVSRK